MAVTAPSPIRQRYEQIADHLAGEIAAGRLAPGERLPGERELAQQLEVGRASVREALAYLQLQDLIVTRRGSGSYVADDAPERIAERAGTGELAPVPDAGPAAVLQARLITEPPVARLAAQAAPHDGEELTRLLATMDASMDPADPAQRRRWSDADRSFHREIAVLTGNPVLVAIADRLACTMDEPLWRRLRDESIAVPGRTTLQLAEHRLIAASILEGDPDAAELHARQHIQRARRYMALEDHQEPR
ncbi:MAG TPA: FCD domain-containing protein [Solirubrobacteraceae bacterium]|nr:FCD domain-containing protein [Solirubrobacteraceae bacterium]